MSGTSTLDDLVREIGDDSFEIVVRAPGATPALVEVRIFDEQALPSLSPGVVLLAVGVRPNAVEFQKLLTYATTRRIAAVIVKAETGDITEEMAALAQGREIAIVRVPPTVEWGHLHTVIRLALSVGSPASPDSADGLNDLFALAHAIAVRVGGPVTIEDPQSRLIAYSSQMEGVDEFRRDTILGRHVPEAWLEQLRSQGVFRRLWKGEVVRVTQDDPKYRDRMAIGVLAGPEPLGSIWVQEGRLPFSESTEAVLRESSEIAAMQLIRLRAVAGERNFLSELVTATLFGHTPSAALAEAMRTNPRSPHFVIGFSPADQPSVAQAVGLERILQSVNLFRRTSNAPMAATQTQTSVYAVLEASDRNRTLVRDLARRVRSACGFPVLIVQATSEPAIQQLVAARIEVDEILAVADVSHLREADDVLRLDDVFGAVFLGRLRRAAELSPELRKGRLDRLVRDSADNAKSDAHLVTLRNFLDCHGDVAKAAEREGVHVNTLRYRLKRAVELAGVDLDDPLDRLALHLQLHLHSNEPNR